MAKVEMLRRLRLRDLRRYCLHRYGYTLPDDDAGREDLRELLLPISLTKEAGRKMEKAIEVWAPWMNTIEAGQLMDEINRTPGHLRKPGARELGERLNLQNWQRERWGIRTIAPVDMTATELAQRRKAKHRETMRRRRRAIGGKPRQVYLANSISREKPWEKDGISRAQWYRNRKKSQHETSPCADQQSHETSPCAIKLTTVSHTLVSSNKVDLTKRTSDERIDERLRHKLGSGRR
jgi:hypothetical protein